MDKRKKNEKNISVVFLLAGFGKRISNLTKNPKCLLKINKESIIIKNLKLLKELGIKNVTLVLGYKYKLIKKEISNQKKNFNFFYVYNNNFRKLGNTYSLFKGLNNTNGKVLVFDGDLIFSKKILKNFLNYGYDSSFLIGKTSIKNVECAKALADKKGFIRKTIDKRLIKKSEINKYKFVGEAIGIIKVTNKLRKIMVRELKKFLKIKNNLPLNWEHFMNEFLKDYNIKYNKTSSSKWIEVDTKKDFIRAKYLFKNT
tara:strand:+ start:810 stop:1580 length:771 start_codon:yes stop_codon:yes gene_type:complete